MKKMLPLPTDLAILEAIFAEYHNEYISYEKGSPKRADKRFVPLDLERIAKGLRTNSEVILARLYHHFERKYGYKIGAVEVQFFALDVQWPEHLRELDRAPDTFCINFAYMQAILAELQYEDWKGRRTYLIARTSIMIAIINICFTIGFTVYKTIHDDARQATVNHPGTPLLRPAGTAPMPPRTGPSTTPNASTTIR
jgi:hypothetical protein